MAQNYLFIMAKYPRMGQVKTRLGRSLGYGRSVNIYRSLLLKTFRKMCHDPRWQTILAISPDEFITAPIWPLSPWRIPQGSGDLGARMGRIMEKSPSGSVVIIGADCPSVCSCDIAEAFLKLKKNQVVFGPSQDGGYWLVGQKGLRRSDMFRNVRWSTEHTLHDTLENCKGMSVGMLRSLRDIDNEEDYRTWLRLGAF